MAAHTAVGIIGTGWVGSSVAMCVLQAGIARDLLLADARPSLAEGEAMDLMHGSSFYPSASVRSAEVEDMLATDALVIAAGHNSTPTQSRLDLLNANAQLVGELAQRLKNYQGTVIMVTNPVDVLTAHFTRISGLPSGRVIGTGTMLDTSRLRQLLGEELGVHPLSVHAQIVGEHGDSEVALWSSAEAGGLRLRAWPDWNRERETRVGEAVRRAAYEIIQRKGATNHAIGLVTAALLRTVLRDERRILTVSTLQTGIPGMGDLAFSLPAIVGSGGVLRAFEPQMDDGERAALERSAEVLRRSLASVQPS